MTPKLPGADCAHCPGRDEPMVPPETSQHVRLAIVGESPGATEFAKGRPFVGASGRLLGKGMRHLGLDRGQVHWTNAVPCKVRNKDLAKARKCCAGRLRAELQATDARVIMPVGAHGTRSVLGLKSAPIMKFRGSVSPVQLDGPATDMHAAMRTRAAWNRWVPSARFVCPTIHPAFALRQPLWMPVLERDVERVGRVLAQGWTPPELQDSRVMLFPRTERQLEAALSRLATPDLGGDVETVGLGPCYTELVCFALSDGTTTVIVPWARNSAASADWWVRPQWVAGLVSEVIADRTIVTHNGPIFDHIVFDRYGIKIRQWEDTLIAVHAFESHLPKGLARVATTYLDVGPWKTWEHSKRLTDLWVYNGRDTLYTILAWREMKGNVT